MTQHRSHAGVAAAIALIAAVAAVEPAAAAPEDDEVVIGLYAPSAPFGGTGERMQFITELAAHLESDLGVEVTGRVYASSTSLAEAFKKGEIRYAVVDTPYLTMRGNPWKVLATAQRNGSTTTSWQIVASAKIGGLSDLAGKNLAVAQAGGKEASFATGVMLEGEVGASYFGKVVTTPDALSAIKSVSLGRADAAMVPSGLDTEGLGSVVTLRAVPWPSLVAGPGVDAKLSTRVASSARSWSGAGPFSGFGGAADTSLGSGKSKKKPVMATPPARKLQVKAIVRNRTFVLTSSDLRRYVTAR